MGPDHGSLIRVNTVRNLLQIVPVLPGQQEAVGDYAQTLARKLRAKAGFESTFVTGEMLTQRLPSFRDIILHYVNYGYHPRGVPSRLLSILRKLRGGCAGKLITIFHELYASAPPWRSAFWLRPRQMQIARDVARLSDDCVVTNEIARAQLQRLVPNARIIVRPVFSNFGEPEFSPSQIAQRDPQRWTICGGTAAIGRALRSFIAQRRKIPAEVSPTRLHILGGMENDAIRKAIVDLAPMSVDYRPSITADEASNLLREAAFAWFDYFHRANVPGAVLLKSGAFAAACAHAVIPIFARPISQIATELPSPFSIDNFPPAHMRHEMAEQYYNWYQTHASSDGLTNCIAALLT